MSKLSSINQFMQNVAENNMLKKENFSIISGGNSTCVETWQCTEENVAGCQTNPNKDARKYNDGNATMDITSDCDRMKKLEICC
jgi:hypothetical protein